MLRRDFLKLSGIIPFVGSLSIVGRAGASEWQPEWIKESFRRQDICRPKPVEGGPMTAAKVCNIALEKIGENPIGIVESCETWSDKDGNKYYYAWIHPIEGE